MDTLSYLPWGLVSASECWAYHLKAEAIWLRLSLRGVSNVTALSLSPAEALSHVACVSAMPDRPCLGASAQPQAVRCIACTMYLVTGFPSLFPGARPVVADIAA